MVWLLCIVAALWVAAAVHDTLAVAQLATLPARRPLAPAAEVTVVMAVRDDAAHIEASIALLLRQQHVRLQLVVVDDRSSDGTNAALARVAEHDPRVKVLTIDELPPDWLGKTHALQVGAHDATTPWLLFTDGDARLAPDALARAIDAAELANAQHVSLLPTHRDTTLLGRACLLAFQLVIQRRIAAVNATKQRTYVGTGAFNLVRTDAYRAIGGHLPLRLEVLDDVWLGGLLFRAGYRSRVWFAANDLAIDWGRTPRDLVRVTTKNMFAILRFHTLLTVVAIVAVVALLAFTFVAPCLHSLGWLPLAAYGMCAVPGMHLARRMNWSLLAGLMVPLGRVLLPIALANSLWVTLRQGGVRWRGTFYPLAQLRRGQVTSR